MLSGCSGESSGDSNRSVESSLESPAGNVDEVDPELDSVGDGDPEEVVDTEDELPYSREEVYPNIVKLPLEFFSTVNGKKIGVSVTLPANQEGEPIDSTFPALLVQTAYNMSLVSTPSSSGALSGGADPFLVKRGYAMVTVDVLGGGVSEGGWELLGEEEQNAYGDAVDWVLRQDWSDGIIGVSGASYMAITSLFTAQQRPDAIKAVFAVVPLGDAQRGTAGTGGLLNGVFMKTWMTLTQKLGTQNMLASILNPQHFSQILRSTQEHIEHIDRFYLPLLDDALAGEEYIRYDGDFWRTRAPLEDIDKITAPTFITGALHDIFQRDEPLLYERLKENVDARLAIFDGDHISNMVAASEGSDAISPLAVLMLQWFDKHLMGLDSGTENIPAVTQYVKNYESESEDGFATSSTWPHPLAESDRWYLHSDLSLSQELPVIGESGLIMHASDFALIEYGKSSGGQFLEFEVTPVDGSDCSLSYRQWTLGECTYE